MASAAVLVAALGALLAVGPATLRVAPLAMASAQAAGDPGNASPSANPVRKSGQDPPDQGPPITDPPDEPDPREETGKPVTEEPDREPTTTTPPDPEPSETEPGPSETEPSDTPPPETEPSDAEPSPSPVGVPPMPAPEPSQRRRTAAVPSTTPSPSPATSSPARAGVVWPDRVPEDGSQPRVDGDPDPTEAAAAGAVGWTPLFSSRDVGIRIFFAGLVALVIAIAGLVTVAVRGRQW